MEIGNLLFGNSRGLWAIEDRDAYQKVFWDYFEEYFDYCMYPVNGAKYYDGRFLTDRGGFENEIFMANPYYWGDDEEIAEKPNFIYKPTGLEISWYKYPLRDAFANREISLEEFDAVCKACVESICME